MSPQFDLDHLCQLAHLDLEPEEKAKLRFQMEQIVAWVGKLSEPALSKIEIESEEPRRLPLRPDKVEPSFPSKVALEPAPERDDAFIKVPKVIEER